MPNVLTLIATFLGGLAAGAIYFFVLWTSLNRYLQNRRGLSFFLSFLARITLLLSLLYLIANNHFVSYVVFMAAFFFAKIIAVKVVKWHKDRPYADHA